MSAIPKIKPKVVTQNNKIVWEWESKPFGESKPNEDVDNDGNKFTLNLRFPEQYYDAETNKHYNINRDYDPVTGRYIQSDPIGFEGGSSTYVYAGGNPIVRLDESGLWISDLFDPISLNPNEDAKLAKLSAEMKKAKDTGKFKLYKFEIKKNSIIVKDYFTEKRIAEVPIGELRKIPSLSEQTWADDLIKRNSKPREVRNIRNKKDKIKVILELLARIFH